MKIVQSKFLPSPRALPVFIHVFVLGLALFGLTACDEKPASKAETVITVQMFEGPEFKAMVPTAQYWNEHYAKKTGIRIKATKLNRVGYFGKLHTQLVSGIETPDIVHPFSLHLGRIAGYLEPLDPYFADKNLMTAPDGEKLSKGLMLDAALRTVAMPDGNIYMVPKDMSEVVLYYRKDLILKPPETWDEFVILAQNMTRDINPESPTEFGAVMQGKYEMWTFCAALENFWPLGASVLNADATAPGFDRANTVNGFKVFETLSRQGVFPPGTENAEYPQVAKIIKSGQVAMAVQWNAFYGVLTDPAQSPKVHDKFDIAPPPGVKQSDGTIKRQMYVQTIGLAINRNSKNKREAMKFLAWASLGEGAEIYAKAGGSSPVARVWKAKDAQMPYPKLAPWVEAYGRSPSNHPKLTDLMMVGSSWVQRVIMGDVNSEQAAIGMQKEMAAALEKSEGN